MTAAECSRAGCRLAAEWNVNWRNPRLHTADRVKVWLACPQHRDFLHDYLSSRGFPVVVTPFGVSVERVPDAAGTRDADAEAAEGSAP